MTTWSSWAPPDLDAPLFEVRLVRDRLSKAEAREMWRQARRRHVTLGLLALLCLVLVVWMRAWAALVAMGIWLGGLLLVLVLLGRLVARRHGPGTVALSATRRGVRLTALSRKHVPWHLIEGFGVKKAYGMEVVRMHPGESWRYRLIVSMTDWPGTAQELVHHLEGLRAWVATAAFTTGEPPPAP